MDDDLLNALGRLQREQDTAGAVGSADELAPIEGDEADALLELAFARVDGARKAEAAVEHEEPEEPEEPEVEGDVADKVGASADEDPRIGDVVPFARVEQGPAPVGAERSNPWRVAVGVAVALAAVALLWVGVGAGGARLPDYAVVALHSGVAAQRSADEQAGVRERLKADGPVDWKFAPQVATATKLGVALLARGADGTQRFSRAKGVQISPSGALRMHGTLAEFIVLTPGEWELQVIIAAEDDLPDTAREAAAGNEDWQIVAVDVTLLPN